jgi:hypothetical protein
MPKDARTRYVEPLGYERLRDAALNKGAAFTEEERDRYRLHRLLPVLKGRNERLLHRVAINHIETLLPLIYTPTVGQAWAQGLGGMRGRRIRKACCTTRCTEYLIRGIL